MNKLSRFFAIVFVSLMLVSMVSGSITLGFASAQTPLSHADSPKIWTDKADYHPGETVTIYGTNFLPNTFIDLNVTKQNDGTNTLWKSNTDANGNFKATYQIGTVGAPLYTVKATDGTNTAKTTFTDPPIARIGVNARGTSTSNGISVTMGQTPTSGNVLIAVIGTTRSSSSTARTVNSITQTGVSWGSSSQVDNQDTNTHGTSVEIWLGTISSGASTSVSISLSGSADGGAVADICEYSGIVTSSPLDRSATSSSSSTSTSTGTTTSATRQPSELWIGGVTVEAAVAQTSSGTSAPTNGFTLLDGATSTSASVAYLEKIVSTTGTASTGTSISPATRYDGCVATFYAIHAISLSPASGNVGSSVSVSGSGLVASHSITATFDGSSVTLSGTTSTDASGAFTGATFTVPASAYGPRTVVISDGTNSPSATYTVISAISLNPTVGNVGDTVTLTATGLVGGHSGCTATFGGSALTLSSTSTNSHGALSATFTVPATTSGSKTVQLSDGTNTATAAFTVNSKITLSPTSGAVGSSVTVTATGMLGSQSGCTANLGGTAVTLSTTTTTATGGLSATFTVPSSAFGSKTFTLTDGSNSPTASFTVTSSISLSPATGNVGSSVSVSGSGMVASHTITATFNGAAVTLSGTTSTDSSGSFAGATFTVPASTSGAKTGVISDGTNSPSATYTVVSSVSLSPTSGNVGDTVTLTATGMLGSHSGCTANLGGTAVTLSTSTTTSTGGLSATFAVPASTPGSKTFTLTDGTNSPTATFAVTDLTLGYVGSYSTGYANSNSWFIADAVTPNQAFTVTSINAWGQHGGNCKVAIYDNLNGHPNNRLSSTITLSMSSSGAWSSGTVSPAVNLAAGSTYWLVIDFDTSNGVGAYTTANTRIGYSLTYSSALPATAPTSGYTTIGSYVDCIFVSGTATPTVSAPTLNPASPITYGNSVTSSVTLSAFNGEALPTGTVTFQVSTDGGSTYNAFGVAKTLSSGSATSDSYMPSTVSNNYRLRAVYNGDNSYNTASGSAASLTVNQATANVQAPTFTPAGPINPGQSVSVSATVSAISGGATPTGSFTFRDSSNGGSSWTNFASNIPLSSGSASTSFTPSSSGNYIFDAIYNGDTNYVSSTGESSSTLTVNSGLSVIVSPASWTMDVGQSKMFTATASGGSGSYVSYQWYVNGVAQNGQIAQTFTYSPGATGSSSITVTVTDSLDSTSPQSSAATVTVAASPTVSITPVGSLIMDVGQFQVFTATHSGGSGVIHYQWFVGAVLQSETSSSFTYSAGSAGSYSVTCVITDSASTPVTSPNSNAVSITVSAAQTVSVTPTSVTLDVGQTQTFTCTASGGTGTLNYQWYLDGLLVSGQTGITYIYSAMSAGSSTIYCKVTDSASTPNVVQSNTPSITVNAAPTVSVLPSYWTMDLGQSKQFSATAIGGSGTYISYQWYVDGTLQAENAATFTYIASATGTYSITVTVTDSLTATSPESSPVSVTVNTALVAPTTSASPNTIDQGQTSSLTSSALTTGSSPYTYQWLSKAPGDSSYSPISGATSSSYSFITTTSTAIGSWSFEVQVTDTASVSLTSSPDTIVVVNTAPSASVSPISWTMDLGQTKEFTATTIGGSGTYSSYQWYVDGAIQSGQTTSTFIYNPSTAGSHLITVTVTDSLDATSTQSLPVSLTVNSALRVSVLPGSWGMDLGQSKMFSAVAAGGSGSYVSYQWFVDGVVQNGETASTFTYSAASVGSYSITVTVSDSLGSTSAQSLAASVTVNSALVAPAVSAVPSTVDQGQTSGLSSAAVTTGTSGYTYQWLVKGPNDVVFSQVSGATSSSYSFVTSSSTAMGSWSFELQVTDGAGVVVTSSPDTVVVVNSAPTVSAAPVSWTMNMGQDKVFTAAAVGGSGVYTGYQWYVDGSAVLGAVAETFDYVPVSAGSYSITVTVTDSLGATSALSSAASVTVNAALSVSVLPGSWGMDVGQSKMFSAVAAGGSGSYVSYQWFVDGVVQNGETASTFTYSAASTGSYSITVTVSDSLGSTSAQSLAASVTVNSALVAPAVSAVPSTVDQGQTSGLSSAAVTTGTSGYTYQWLVKGPNDVVFSQVSGATSSSYSFVTSSSTAMGSWSFELQVTDGAGVVVTSSPDTVVVVNSAPTVSAAPVSWTMNMGQDKVFTAAAVGGSGVYTGYQWYVDGSAVLGAVAETFDYVPVSAGSYSITVTVTDSLGATSALSSAASVTVNAALSVSVLPGSWGMDVGQSKMFSAVAAGGSGSYVSYQWFVDGVVQNGETASTFTYSAASTGSYSITVTVSDSLGSTSPLSSAVSVVVAASPAVNIAPTGQLMMDVGQTQLFSATSSGGSGMIHYQWYVGATAVGTDSSSYTFTGSGTLASVSCVVTDSASTPVSSPASNTVSITVSASPTVSITPVGSLTMDVGQSQLFTASAIDGFGTIHYEWYVNGIAFGTDSSSCTYTASGSSASITCVVTDSASTPVTSPVSNAVSITINAAQTVVVTPNLVLMDVGQSQTFTCTVSGGTGTLHYQWYVAGLAVSGQTGTTYSFTAGSSGSPTIYCIVTDSASTPFAVQSNTPTVTVASDLSVSVSPGSWTMDIGQSKMFTAVPIGGSGSYTGYQWYVNGVAQSGKTTSTFTCSPGTGSYSITVTVTDSLGATSAQSSAATLTMNAALSTPSVSASSAVVTQGQSSTLSVTGLSGGSTPYNYQWFEKSPGTGSYVIIGGATSSTYPFSTSSSTTIGVWSFEVQVTDSSSSAVTVTSSSTKVIVNSGSTVWDFEDHTYSHTSLLTETSAQIISEETQQNALFAQYGLPMPIALAYPNGEYNAQVESVISQYRLTARLASNGAEFMSYPISNYYEMSSKVLQWDTTFFEIKAYIDYTVAQKGQLNLFTHQVSSNVASLQTYGGCTPELLGQIVAYLKDQQDSGNLQVLTARQAYYAFNGQIAAVTVSFDDSLTTDYTVAYPLFQQYGLAGTSYTIGGAVGAIDINLPRLTWAQIDEMAQTSPPAWTLTVNSSPSAGGSTSVSGTTSVQQFSLPVTATAAPGYVFVGWSFDGIMSLTNPIALGQGQEAGGSVHTLTAYFIPATSSPVFTDDFETGSLSNWWASSDSSTIVTSPVHAGSYSAKASGSTYWDHYLSSGQSDLFFAGYVQFSQLPASDQAVYFMYINDGSYTYTVRGGIYESASGTSNQWLLGIGGDWFLSSSPANLQTNHWYFMEIEYNANGVARMWVDGALVSIGSGSAMLNAQDVQGGNPFGATPSDFISYGDDYSVATSYIPVTYHITVTQSSNGLISPTTASYTQSSSVTETITPNSGYYIASITVDGVPITVTSSSGQTVSFISVQADHTITATFTRNWQITVIQTANGLISPASAIYTEGSNPSETITPNSGYYIATITVDGVSITVTSSSGQTVSFNMLASHTITATFAPITVTYQITVTQTANGLISPGTASCPAGSSQDEVITPSTGFYITSITVDGNPVIVASILGQTVGFNNIAASHTVTATYAQITWQITVTQTSNGLISPNTASYAQGTSPSETITPNSGYYIASITVDGIPITVTSSSGQTVSFNDIQAAHTITATYAQITWQITVTQSSNGLISPDTASYDQGSSPGETVTPASGYYIASITVDGTPISVTSSSGQTVNFNNIQAAHTITATFALTQITYQITVTQSANGNIAPATASYAQGSSQDETITPSAGYYIASITVDGSSVAVSTSAGQVVSFTNIIAAHSITATFAQVTIPPSISISLSGTQGLNGWYDSSVTVTLTATDHSGSGIKEIHYILDSGSEQIVAASSTQFVISTAGVHSVSYWAMDNVGNIETHNSQQIKIDLTMPITTASFSGTLLSGSTNWYIGSAAVTLTATEYSSGIQYIYYSLDGGVTWNTYTVSAPLTFSAQTTFTITNTGQNTIEYYSVDYSGDTESTNSIQVNVAYTVTPSAPGSGSGGSISPSTPQNVVYDATPTFTVTPDAGYHLLDLKVDGTSVLSQIVGNSYTFPAVTANHNIVATFAQTMWQITVTQSDNGLISPVTASYAQSSSVTETITPNVGYHIASITVNGQAVAVTNAAGQTYQFDAITADGSISASFAVNVFTIAASAGSGGSISPSGSVNVNYGESQTFTVTANTGYHLVSVLIDGVAAAAPYTISNVVDNTHTIVASFAIDTFAITVTQGANGLISGPSSADYGTDASYTFAPATGYHIVDVLVDGVSKGAVASYTIVSVKETHTITASFSVNGVSANSAYLVVRGADNTIYYRTFDSALGTWNPWVALPGSTCDSPAAVVCGNELHIVVRGMDGITLWHGYVNLVDGSFSGWTWISGTTPSPPTLTSNGNVITLVVRGADNSVYYRVYTVQTRTWNDWKAFEGKLTCDKVSAVMQGNVLSVVARGYSATNPDENYMLWQASVNLDSGALSGGSWIPGSAPSSPTIASWQNGNGYCLVVRGMDNTIYINVYSDSAWRGWTALTAGSTAESPTATVIGDKLYLIVVGMDGITLWQSNLDLNSSSFSGWTWISGTTPSKPVLIS